MASEHGCKSLTAVSEVLETETAPRKLRLIREAREKMNEDASWLAEIETAFESTAGKAKDA